MGEGAQVYGWGLYASDQRGEWMVFRSRMVRGIVGGGLLLAVISVIMGKTLF